MKLHKTPKRWLVSLCVFLVLVLIFFVLLKPESIQAATRTWDGGGIDAKWSTCANWSLDTCPVAADVVTFDATSTKSSSVDAGFGTTIAHMSIAAGYSGTITLERSLIVSNTYQQVTGTFTAVAQTLTVTGDYILSGGTFTASSGSTTFGSNFTISGSAVFNANGGTIAFAGSGTSIMACNNAVFNQVTFSKTSSAQVTVGSACSLPLGNNPTVTVGSVGMYVSGTLSGTGTYSHSGGPFRLQSGAVFSGFSGLNVTSGLDVATAMDFSSFTTFNLAGQVNLTAGSLSLPAPTGSIAISALSITGGAFTASPQTMTITDGLTISGSATFNANGGTILFSGSNTAILSCNNAVFSHVTISKVSSAQMTVGSNCSLPLGNNPTVTMGSIGLYVNGTLSGTGTYTQTGGLISLSAGSALSGFSAFASAGLTISGGTADFSAYSSFSTSGQLFMTSGSILLPTNADLNADLTISGGTFTAPSSNMTVAGALTISGSPTFNANSGTITFDGSAATLSCNAVTFNRVSFTGQTGIKTVNSNCTLPLGNDPTVPNGLIHNGTLTGTGTLTMTTGTLTLNSGEAMTGFSGMALNALTVSGATANLSGLSSMTVAGAAAVSSGILTLPNGAILSSTLTISSTGTVAATTGNVTVVGAFTLTAGTVTAPTGTLSLGGTFTHTAGTFTANGGTVNFNSSAATQTIAGVATTFYNLTKTVPSASAKTLTFPAGVTETVTNTLTLHGYDASSRLLLRSSSASQWRIDAQGTRDMLYVDVKDGNSINAAPIQMGGTGSLDSTNNTNFNFNSVTPNDPTTLGPINVVSGVTALTLQPVFTFSLTDPNQLDTVKYQIQISTNADFSSPVIDYTSAFAGQGGKTFTVGQAVGTGTYTAGTNGQTLATASYYWRVKSFDNNSLISNFSLGNSGSIAFLIDADPPDIFTPTLNVTSPTSTVRPSLSFSTTDNVAIDHYQVKVDEEAFSTQTSPYLLPTLTSGAHTITVRAFDTTGNLRDGNVSVTIDTSNPNAFTPTLNVTSPTATDTPILSFVTTDTNGIDHYEVQIDGGAFATQTSPYQLPTQSEGNHTFTVRAFDTAGNSTDGIASLTIITSVPDAFTPTLNVSSPTTNTAPILTFSTTAVGGIDHYEVKVDSDAFSTQVSPYQLPALSINSHTMTVRAYNTVGNFTDGQVSVTIIITPTPTPTPSPTSNSNHDEANSSSPSMPNAPTCDQAAPTSAPWLYSAVALDDTRIQLSFGEAAGEVDVYALTFGTTSNAYTFGELVIGGKGSRTYVVQSLMPNTKYYFRVRGGHGCAPGEWSSEISAKTRGHFATNMLELSVPELEIHSNDSSELLAKDEVTNLPQTYTLHLQLIDESKNPLVGINVAIPSQTQTATTNDSGLVQFTNLKAGTYTFSVQDGHYEGEQSIQVGGMNASLTFSITARLKKFWVSRSVVAGIIVSVGVLGGVLILIKRKMSL